MIWIVDASVALKWFVEEERHPHADEVLKRIVERPEQFAVPELFAFEVHAVLQWVHPSAQKVFVAGILPLLQGGLLREPMTEKLARHADRFVRLGLTGYDACYAALARQLSGVWLTFDARAHAAIARERISCFLGDTLPEGWLD
jgi:predicted nucleic acid-binding protein